MARGKDRLFIGIAGHVVALDAATGEELWRTRLKASSFATLAVEGKRVFAGANGELFCLDAATGGILWHNPLKGLRMGIVSFASGSVESIAAAIAAQAAAAAG